MPEPETPDDPTDFDGILSSDLQLRAVSNLVRHRILTLLRTEPASITQVATRLGIAKGSASYHMRFLEKAGLVAVVTTRKVRGVTERHYARTTQAIRLPESGPGQPNRLMRHAMADLEAAPSGPPRMVRMHHARLSPQRYKEFIAHMEKQLDELRAVEDPAEPLATMFVAIFRPEDHR